MSKCLVKEAKQRPSIESLAKHAFLRTHKETSLADMLAWAVGNDK